MFKKLHISPSIFKQSAVSREELSLDEKMDEIIRLLSATDIDIHKRNELHKKLNAAIRGVITEEDITETDSNSEWIQDEMDIILSRRQTKRIYKKVSPIKHISVAFRMLISVLMIVLGFAMIILPTPQAFEIYTLYYFNANDGFTVMDLISLIIVFCGIYTLITARKNR